MSTTPTPAPKTSIWDKIKNSLEWFGKELGRGIGLLPKVIKLTEDAEAVASDALPKTLAVVKDAGALVTAAAKDSGKFLTSLGALTAALSVAVAAKALSPSADVAVVGAFESFCSDFKAANVEDVLNALHQLAQDVHALDASVVADIQKMEADAKS